MGKRKNKNMTDEEALEAIKHITEEPKEYCVFIREVHVSHRIVKAHSEGEALNLAGDAEEHCLEYSYTLPMKTWTFYET